MTKSMTSEKIHRRLIENTRDGIFLFNEDGDILQVNDDALQMLGYPQEVFLRKKIQELLPVDGRGTFTRLLGQEKCSLPLNLIKEDKSPLPVLLSTSKMSSLEGTFFLGIIRDLREREKQRGGHRRGNRKLWALNTISQTVSRHDALDELLREALESVLKMTKVEAGMVFLVNERTRERNLQFFYGIPTDLVEAIAKAVVDESFSGHVAGTGDSISSKNILRDPRPASKPTHEMIKRAGFRTLADIPLKSGNQVVGIMNLVSCRQRCFTSEEMALLESMGNQIGIAIEKALALEKEQKRSNQLTIINEVSREMAQITDLDELLDKIARCIQTKLGYPDVGIFIKEPQADEATLRAGFGMWKEVVKVGYRQKIGEGIVGWVITNGRTMLVGDTSKEPLYKKVKGVDAYSELCVPIKLGDRVFGAINIESPKAYGFDDQDIGVLETLADRLGIAIENIRLYENIGLERDKLNAILENMGEGVSIVDKNYHIHYRNNWLKDRVDKAHEKETCFETFIGRSQPCPRCPLHDVVDNFTFGTIEIASTDHKTYLMTYTPLKTQKDGVFMLEIFKDISDRKKYEQECLRIEKLQTAVSLARAVAHELNQPLTGIVGYCSLIREEISEQNGFYEDFQKIERQADRISQLIRKFQNIVRLEQKSYLGDDRILDIEKSTSK